MSNNLNIEIGRFIKDIIKNRPDKIFIFDSLKNKVYTYKEFFSKVLDYKNKLEKLGFKKDETLCLIMNNSIELAVLYFSCLIADIIAAPIYPQKGEEEIKQILSQTKYKGIITSIEELNFMQNAINIKEFENIQHNKSIDINEGLSVFEKLDYEKLFLITFTSGSTGTPKGVMNSFKNLFLTAIAFRNRFNFNDKNIFYHNLPMTYMAGILNLIFLPFLSESKIVIGNRFSIANLSDFWDIPIRYNVNTFWLIPTIINLLLKVDRGTRGINFGTRNKIIACVGTAPLSYEAKIQFESKYKIPLYESYGLSETLFVSTNYPGKDNSRDKTVGKPLEGVEIEFMNDKEIAISVPWMFLGYTNVDTKEYFRNNRYLSGDIGEIDKDGFLKITGRKKDLIIRGGININPKRIEDTISAIGNFEEIVILGVKDPILGEKIVCFYVKKQSGGDKDILKEINKKIIYRLGKDYKIDEFIELKAIPRNINGKIDKLTIRKNYLNQNDNKN